MEEIVCKEIKHRDRILRIVLDKSPINPRKEWDNLGHMVCWHKNYELGDKHNFTVKGFQKFRESREMVIMPLYLLDHSGLCMQCNSFNDPWDSGQVGYIYMTLKEIKKEFKVNGINDSLVEKIKDILLEEVKVYDYYLRGEVFGFTISKLKQCSLGYDHEEIIDSCYGFLGSDNKTSGLLDHLSVEWRKLLEKN